MPRQSGYEQVIPQSNRNGHAPFAQRRPRFPKAGRASAVAAGAALWLAATPAAAQPSPSPSAAELDWTPLEELSAQQRAAVPRACCGLYVAPPLPAVEGDAQDLVLDSEAGVYQEEAGVLTLEGRLQAVYEDSLVEGDRGTYDMNSETFVVEGNIRVRQPGLLMVGEEATVRRAEATSELRDASYVLHEEHARGTADIIVYTDEDGVITIDNGRFSRCEPGDNSWAVQGRRIELDQEAGRGVARDLTLRVRDVPVFYTPWLSFPINDERASGFLAPIIGSTRTGGMDFATPYYFNLAPNYDATLTPRWISDRGLMLGLEARHLSRWSRNEVEMTWLPDDDQYDPAQAGQSGSDTPPTPDRWLLDIDHIGRLGAGWTSFVDYNAVSDRRYFQDLGSTGLDVTTRSYMGRSGGLRYVGDNWRFTSGLLGYQLIDPNVDEINRPYERLPRLTLDGFYYPTPNLEYGLSAEYVYFHRELDQGQLEQAQIERGAMVTGHRLSLEPEVSLPWRTPGAFVVPTAKYRLASYQLDDVATDAPEDPSRGIFVGSVDSGLVFERDLSLFDRNLVQTLEPRLFYLYSEYEDQSDIPLFDSGEMTFSYNQLFREDRFSGLDRVGDANQLTAAVTTRLLDSRGRERARASVGQIFHFADRRVSLRSYPDRDLTGPDERRDTSALAGELSYQFSDNWRAYSYLEWDTEDQSVDVGNFQFRYQSDINHIFNFSYRFRDVPNRFTANGIDRRINQTDVSAVWPLRDNLGLIGRWNYDHANNRNLEVIAGLEYTNCCWSTRLIAREWIDNDLLFFGEVEENTGIFLQFELKGFGSVLGGNVSGILSNGITGYREREL